MPVCHFTHNTSLILAYLLSEVGEATKIGKTHLVVNMVVFIMLVSSVLCIFMRSKTVVIIILGWPLK